MNKQLLTLLCVFSFFSASAQVNVTGKVTDASTGEGLPGVSVVVGGQATGSVTDLDGNYKISAKPEDVIRFSFVGYLTVDEIVGSRTVIDLKMGVDTKELEEVVVTAFGMEKKKKALGYSVTELDGEDFTQAREISIADGLSGKVAGVNVSNIGSGVAGSSRVIIRGNTSLSGNNQPLYIIDGVPMDNSQLGAAGMWGGSDFGDGISSLNPDDIEKISVLKGGTAAALYGSRASNGVILITTKSGSNRKGIGVEFNSNYTFEKMQNFFDFQTEYGHGNRGVKPTNLTEALDYGGSAWGAKLDGSSVIQYDGESRPYSYFGDNFSKFYRTGSTFTNTLSLTGGSATQSFRFSASNLDNKSITPNSGMNRKNFTMSINSKWADKLSLTTKVQYVNEDVDNRARLSDAPGNANYTLAFLPPSINVEDLKGPTDKLGADEAGNELTYSGNVWSQNPYWASYQFTTKDIKDRVIGSTLLKYDITDWLYIQGRVGMDSYTNRRTTVIPYGTAYSPRGSMVENEQRIKEVNMEAIVGANKTFGDVSVSLMAGANRMRTSWESLGGSGSNFNIPFFHTMSNAQDKTPTYGFSQSGINSVFGQAEASYKNIVFLNVSGRNDWFSTLNPDLNSILYPSVGMSFVFSDAFRLPEWVTFGKMRSSWAQVGGATGAYRNALTYSLVGDGHNGAALGRITQTSVPNSTLKPLTNEEIEFGLDVRFFNNRIGIDYTYYKRTTTDDILSAPISETSGYAGATVNVGELSNKGHELLLSVRPLDDKLKWDVSFNFAYNNNEVIKLVGDNTVFAAEEARTRNAFSQHRVAYTDETTGEFVPGGYSVIVGYTHETDDGQKVYDSNGWPVRSANVSVLGSGVQPYTMGLNNSFSYGNFNLSFLLDIRTGGDLFTGTNMRTVGNGLHKMTLAGREDGFEVSGVDENGESQTWTIEPDEIQSYWSRYDDITENFVHDATFIKVRQFVFGYKFPQTFLNKTPFTAASFSLVGRNLWLIHSNLENVDPESTYNSGNGQGLEYFGVPQTRSFGFNLNVKF